MSYAIITGGAKGIGRSFSNLLADKGYDLVLVSRHLEDLAEAQKEIQAKYKVKVHIYVGDLSQASFIDKFIAFAEPYNAEILVNNAGFGHNDLFIDAPLDKELQMIELNIKAVHILTKWFYKKSVTNNKGRIINISSLAGFVPGPYASTYYATKAYVTSLTRALAYEAKKSKTNVLVQVVCPGPIKSEFYKEAGTNPRFYKRSPNYVASLALNSRKTVIVPGFKEKFAHVVLKIIPTSISLKLAGIGQKKKKIK
ncbi:short-subunit dehydrogenase [Acholeplasma morum]|uniref:SDR family NAD(P)-dependent oxidoreductase n=1 Tax=Paracholeplasma morum TaxID=264637 RepID=UPI001959887C|nr:SDR family NAD(P)-dependent oxidoreductase [Paracholeplasma morum]MBM7453599.1 short-subunit dehydrogenase [Paracholeplasma morum]